MSDLPTSKHRSLQQEVQDLRNHVFNGVDLIEHLLRDPTETAKASAREWCATEIARGTDETAAPRALAFGDEVTYAPLYDSKLPREGWKVEVLPKLTYVIKHPNGSLIAVDAGEINAVEPSPRQLNESEREAMGRALERSQTVVDDGSEKALCSRCGGSQVDPDPDFQPCKQCCPKTAEVRASDPHDGITPCPPESRCVECWPENGEGEQNG